MVLPILVAIITAPALLGTQEAIRQSQAKEKREEHRARRCNLIATCVKSSLRSLEINGRPIVLKNNKLYVDTGTRDGDPFGHPYAGYYLPYPDAKHEGLVTTITDVAPIMNWVYVDKDTYEVKYGVRLDAQPNLTGPYDCTRQDRRLTFDGWEGWCAVEERPYEWALYFDIDDNGLRSKIEPGTRVLEIELSRKEKRWQKDSEERQKDQTTSRAVDAKEDAPVDNPQTTQPQLRPPGVYAEDDTQEQVVPQPKSPFKMPQSIFVDPPRPIFADAFEPLVPPKTPPPAYTTNAPPPRGTSTSPLDRSPSGITPPSDKRTTPMLKRSSGTRALAQAQMFEAMAQGNTTTPFTGVKPPSRPVSVATSASDYSNPPKTGVTDIFNLYLDRDSQVLTSPPPVPQMSQGNRGTEASGSAPDPAVFGGFSLKSPRSVTTDGRPPGNMPLGRANSTRLRPNGDAPKAPLPPPPTSRRPPPISSNGRSISPEQRRGAAPNIPGRNGSIERKPSSKYSPPPSRQRNGSTASQNNENPRSGNTPRPLARTNTTPVNGRKSMATTMTSGTRNRGMAARIGNDSKNTSVGSPNRARAQTNSNLYREIDDLVSTSRTRSNTVGRNGVSGNKASAGREDDRPQPLRRAATSRPDGRPGPGRDVGNARGFVRRANRDSLE